MKAIELKFLNKGVCTFVDVYQAYQKYDFMLDAFGRIFLLNLILISSRGFLARSGKAYGFGLKKSQNFIIKNGKNIFVECETPFLLNNLIITRMIAIRQLFTSGKVAIYWILL